MRAPDSGRDRRQRIVLTGLVTRAELLRRGLADADIDKAMADGGLVRVAHGVYRGRTATAASDDRASSTGGAGDRSGPGTPTRDDASRDGPISREPSAGERLLHEYRTRVRAVALRSDDPLISHASAAALYRFPLLRTAIGQVHLTQPGSGGQRRGLVFRHPSAGPTGERRIDGIRVTGPARTLVDLAMTTDFATGVVAVDGALHGSLVTLAELHTNLALATGRTGVRQARQVVTFADGRSESPGESLTRAAIHALGFPAPELQAEVFDAGGSFLGRVDLAYPDRGLLIEFDGLVKYGGLPGGLDARTAVIEEKRREDRLRAAGFTVLRLLWRDVLDRPRLRALLDAALTQAAAASAAGLITGSLVVGS